MGANEPIQLPPFADGDFSYCVAMLYVRPAIHGCNNQSLPHDITTRRIPLVITPHFEDG